MIELSTSQVAKKLKCSNQYVRNLITSDELQAHQVGRTWIITDEDLETWIERTGYVVEPDDHPRKSDKIPQKVALSFFTGAGGLDIGLSNVGITPLLVSDIDKSARRSISKNYPDAGLVGDITKLKIDEIYDYARIPRGSNVDYMFGGPPCQAFSTAGKRRGYQDARGDVFVQYLEIIGRIKPRYAIIENVRGLLSVPAIFSDKDREGVKGGVLLYAIRRLRSFGYSVSFNLYNAANFGAPEIRERVVIIAKLGDDKVDYLEPTNDEYGYFGLPKWLPLKSAIVDLKSNQHYIDYPKKRFKYLKYIPEGGNWRSLPEYMQQEAMGKSYSLPGGKTGFLRRLSMEKPSPTLVTHPTMPATDLIHPKDDRPLSVEEYARIQGFPDDWYIAGNLLDKYRQIGNAVPVPLGEAIGKRILEDDSGIRYEKLKEFKYSRYKNTDEESWEELTIQRLRKDNIHDILKVPDKL